MAATWGLLLADRQIVSFFEAGRGHAGQEAAEMPLPRHAGEGRQKAPDQTAVGHQGDQRHEDGAEAFFKDSPGHQEAEIAEDQPAGSHVVGWPPHDPQAQSADVGNNQRGVDKKPFSVEHDDAAKDLC